MAKQFRGPFWTGENGHDMDLYNQIVAKSDRMWASKPTFKYGISKEDFRSEAMLLFQSRKVHASFKSDKGGFFRFFAVSLRNLMIDKLSSNYSHVKTSRVRETDEEWQRSGKLAGTEMAVQRLDDESLHERIESEASAPDAILGLELYEALIKEIAPTLSSVWFGNVDHPHHLIHPASGQYLKNPKERMAIITDEADRMLCAVAEDLIGCPINDEQHEALVEKIASQFKSWRGKRGEYKKKPEKEPETPP